MAVNKASVETLGGILVKPVIFCSLSELFRGNILDSHTIRAPANVFVVIPSHVYVHILCIGSYPAQAHGQY